MKSPNKESLIFYGIMTILIACLVGGIALPALLLPTNLSPIVIKIMGISWCGLIFLSIVGCDRIAGYYCTPKHSRGSFSFIKEGRQYETFDLSEITAERLRDEEEKAKDSK